MNKNKSTTYGEWSPIFTDCNISVFNQLKHESVITRKNELYIPLLEECFKLIEDCKKGDLFSKLNNLFMKEILQKQYKYRLSEDLLNKLNEIESLIIAYNKIDVINISGNIIVNLFTKGFIELYGEIIDGKAPIYYDGDIIDYEDVYPEEYENIRMIAYDKELIKGLVKKVDEYFVYEDDLYCSELVIMFEFALADRNKRYSPSRRPVNDWTDAPEYYIASSCDFSNEFSSHIDIIKKRNLLKNVSSLCNDLSTSIDQILKDIFEKYERE